MPLLAWSQPKQAFATCNERDLDAGRELSKAPAAAPSRDAIAGFCSTLLHESCT
jgi:hypothetical protein